MIRLDPWAYVMGAAALLLLPLHWLLAAAAAAAVHELCHLGAIAALGGRVYSLTIGPMGAVMEADLPSRQRELLAALAGPAGSFCLVALREIAPQLALCALVQGAFNLLPVFPLDGGRALSCLVGREKCRWISLAVGAGLLLWWPILGTAVLAREIILKERP